MGHGSLWLAGRPPSAPSIYAQFWVSFPTTSQKRLAGLSTSCPSEWTAGSSSSPWLLLLSCLHSQACTPAPRGSQAQMCGPQCVSQAVSPGEPQAEASLRLAFQHLFFSIWHLFFRQPRVRRDDLTCSRSNTSSYHIMLAHAAPALCTQQPLTDILRSWTRNAIRQIRHKLV